MQQTDQPTKLTLYGFSNVSTTLGESCENVGTLSCWNIFQESFKNVATMLPQNVVRKHLHNIMAKFIHVDKCYDIYNGVATFLQYGKIRENIRTCFRKRIDGVKSDVKCRT